MVRAKITTEQAIAIQASHGAPVLLVDDAGRDTTVAIVPLGMLGVMDGGVFAVSDAYRAQELALSDVWQDPALDEYTAADGTPID